MITPSDVFTVFFFSGKIPYYTMPPTRDVGIPSEAKIITELGKEFNIDEVYGTESFIGSLKSADDFQPTEMLASGTITSDEKMAEVCILPILLLYKHWASLRVYVLLYHSK